MKCNHVWKTVSKRIVAEFQKGKRGKFRTIGDFEVCNLCMEGRFVPANKELRIVACTKENYD